jgi:hypothetical protein
VQARTVEYIIAQNQCNAVDPDKLVAEDESFGEPVMLRLLRVRKYNPSALPSLSSERNRGKPSDVEIISISLIPESMHPPEIIDHRLVEDGEHL